MQDRIPTLPNRKLITPENGTAAFYATVEFADEPTQAGTLINKAFGDVSWFVQYVHSKSGTVHNLTNADGGNIGYFVAAADFESGDTFQVNNSAMTIQLTTGEEPETGFFVAGAIVPFFINGSTICFQGGAGGGTLNFSVEAFASLDALPETAGENTVAIITDTPITGYGFYSSQPSVTTDGFVWIDTATASNASFNALAENALMVYPVSAQQYIGGAWVSKAMRVYKNGEWASPSFLLYQSGDQFSSVTGGWEYALGTGCSGSIEDTYITTSSPGGSNTRTYIMPTNAIDLTNYSTLAVYAVSYHLRDVAGDQSYITVSPDNTMSPGANPTAVAQAALTASATNTEYQWTELDISNVTGSYYLKLWASGYTQKLGQMELR